MKVKVTQEDIDEGFSSATECPVAKALRREYTARDKESITVSVFPEGGRFVYRIWRSGVADIKNLHSLPIHVTNWIDKFDSGIEVEPFEFEI